MPRQVRPRTCRRPPASLKRPRARWTVLAACLVSGLAFAGTASHIHWGYGADNGPRKWAGLDPGYAACATGKHQSPIDIHDATPADLAPIQFDYKPSVLRILDNGHTIQVNVAPGSSITVQGERYELAQFHFHKPSEEKIDGKSFAMVAHLVHKDDRGRLAVVAVLLKEGASNPLIETLWTHLPHVKGREQMVKSVSIDAGTLLPADRAYYTFEGSLTTPPCSEGVTWFVLATPVEVSTAQVAAFGRIYAMNARPTQPLNDRVVRKTR